MTGVGGGGLLDKNSVIKCSIDDLELNEGLIVVSFAHKDNLYQGVLLQLNRERGIPVGISFPKDYFSEDKKSLELPQNSTAPPPPLVQRNTYFQETDNGRQIRSLRRVIKTPARFKNSRMSLRPVQRPVLCAKCGALCNEKDKDNSASGATTGEQSCNSTNGESPKKSGDSPKKPVTPNNTNKSKDIKNKLELNPKVRLSKLPAPHNNGDKDKDKTTIVVENPKLDFNYEGVGTVGVVDNVWKRPLSKPLRYQTRHSLNSAASKPLAARLIKPPSKIVVKTSEVNTRPSPTSGSSISCPVFRITRAPQIKSSDKSRKANNLKLCIKRLTMAAQGAKLEVNVDELGEDEPKLKRKHCSNDNSSPLRLTTLNSANKSAVVPPMKIPLRTQKIKLKRRNSTMPFRRFCDKGENSPTWRTRKVSTMSNPDDVDKLNDLEDDFGSPPRLSLHILKNADRVDCQMEGSENVDAVQPKSPIHSENVQDHPFVSSDLNYLSPIQSPEAFDDSDEGESPSRSHSSSINNKPEPPSKTPVIKITFGTSGNGVVVQIPPRTTNTNHNNKGSTTQEESQGSDTSEMEAKAVRKALKKARKEAKRKQSDKIMLPPTSSNSLSQIPVLEPTTTPLSPIKPALTPLTIQLNSCSNEHYPGNSPERACSPISLHLLTTFSTAPGESTTATDPLDEESEWHGKKKKKAKKRKRQKDHKENDHRIGSSSNTGETRHHHHHNHNQSQLSSPLADSASGTTTAPGLQISSSPIFKSEIINSSHPPMPPMIPMMSNGPKSPKHQLTSVPPPLLRNPRSDLISPNSALSSEGGVLPTTPNNPQRVCISLKRLKDQSNAYVPWNSSCSTATMNCSLSSGDDHNGTTPDSPAENEEPHEFHDDFPQSDDESRGDNLISSQEEFGMESIESYNHLQSNHEYKKGDVVWGKSTGCPWWPGKIVDIQLKEGGVDDARAKIAWYKSAKVNFCFFGDLHPFEEYFESKYTKNRKRGCYQQAVREAMIDAHPMNLQDFATD